MPRPVPKAYLAGPFFNPAQVALMLRIELAFCDAGVPFFSPRLESAENKKEGPLTDEDADAIYARNVEAIFDCDWMLAIVDWLMPDDREVRICDTADPAFALGEGAVLRPQDPHRRVYGKPLNVPDSGTVWELGFVSALNKVSDNYHLVKGRPEMTDKPVVLYTERPLEQPLNLMLTRQKAGVKGVLRDVSSLRQFLNDGRPQWDRLAPYTGRHT